MMADHTNAAEDIFHIISLEPILRDLSASVMC